MTDCWHKHARQAADVVRMLQKTACLELVCKGSCASRRACIKTVEILAAVLDSGVF